MGFCVKTALGAFACFLGAKMYSSVCQEVQGERVAEGKSIGRWGNSWMSAESWQGLKS